MKSHNKTVYIAMSGGVDSSVAAALLKKKGFNVVGVFMKPWSPETSRKPFDYAQGDPASACMWKQDREYAMRVAAILEIPLLTWDFSKEYKKEVGDYMIKEYRAGRTPNPDVMCNKEIKFGLFLKRAIQEGADYIATGHYVLKKAYQLTGLPAYRLYMAKDKNKDQSYFLWTLTQEQLKYCLFPIGNYVKPEVRKLAKKFGLPNHDKKDSQGVCFVGPLDMKEFLKKYIKPKSGNIFDTKSNLIGIHDGVYYYTIGQRHGLNIGNGQGPYFVTSKDIKKNIIYVGKEKNLHGRSMEVSDVSWVKDGVKFPAKVDIKIRYRSKSVPAQILSVRSRNSKFKIQFLSLAQAVTPGQSAVFYKKQEVLGGGIIN